MKFLYEKQARYHMLFVCAMCLLLAGLCMLVADRQAKGTRDALLERERAIASSLLSAGVSPVLVAQAYGSSQSTAEGIAFLEQAGLSGQGDPWLLWTVRKGSKTVWPLLMCGACALGAVWIVGTALFLQHREKIYQEAAGVIEEYASGVFGRHLQRDREGTLYRMFGAIEELSRTLQAKEEAALAAKETLKNTVSDISHQLKTPLAALSMYTEIIQEETDRPQTVSRFSKKSMQSLRRMEALIQTLLKVMRLDAGSVLFEKREYRLARLVEDATESLGARAKRENKRILREGDPDAVLVCDPLWTAEALSCLVKNALDHTEAGGTVRIGWQRFPAMLRIWVADDGRGIAPEDMPHIFKRFYTGQHFGDTKGVGLGLSLAKSIVEGQGGILAAESTPGKGATFFATFFRYDG